MNLLALRNLPLLLSCFILIPSASWAQVRLSPWAVPDRGVAGVTQVNITGAGFPTGTIPPGTVVISIADTCGGSGAIAASASSVTTILGSTRRVEFQVPGALTGGLYALSLSGRTLSGASFSSTDCSNLTIQQKVVSVPNVVGLTKAAATTAIQAAGLFVGTITTASSATIPSGSIISQSPAAATQVNLASSVDLVISIGPSGTIPTSIGIEFSQDVVSAGTTITYSAIPLDANGNPVPGVPSCVLSADHNAASGTLPLLGASITTSSDTRGIYTATCTLSTYSLTAIKTFTVIAPAGTGTTQPGLFGTFSDVINAASQTTSAIVTAIHANDTSEVNVLLTQLRTERDAVDYDALNRSTPFAPEAGFPAPPDQLASLGINPSPQDSNVGPYLNNLIAQLNQLTTFLQTHPLATLSPTDQTTYTQLQSGLSTLVSQLATLNPSAYGVVANESMWNLLGADALPQYFQELVDATDQLLVANGYTGTGKTAVLHDSQTSGSTIRPDIYVHQIQPDFFGVSLEGLTLATSLQLQLIGRVYTQYFQYLIRAEYILLARDAFQAFKGALPLDGVITSGAGLSFNIFHAPGSIIESSVVNLMPQRNDIYLFGPDEETKVAGPIAKLVTNPPKNEDELFKDFQDIRDALSPQNYKESHQLPDSTTDFCYLGNSPPCNQAVYSNGFNSVYATGGLPLPAPVLILVHNLDGSQAENGLWGSGVFNFLPSN